MADLHEPEPQPALQYTPGDERDFLDSIDLSTVRRMTVLCHTGRQLYDAVHQRLESLVQKKKEFPQEVRILLRAPVVEGLSHNSYIRNSLAKIKSLALKGKNIDVRQYESVPAFRGIVCEFDDQRRLTYLSNYAWQTPNSSQPYDHGFVIQDTPADPSPLVTLFETWVNQYWGRDEIHTIVFDFDNTLVFSGEVQVKAWAKAIETALKRGMIKPDQLADTLRYDPKLPPSKNPDLLKDIQDIFIDQQLAESILKVMFIEVDAPILDEINHLRYSLREDLMSQARVFDSVEPMLEELNEHYNFAIISSSDEQSIYKYLSKKGMLKYFSLIMGKNDPGLKVDHDHIHNKSSLMSRMSEIIGIPLSRMVYIGDNQTDYLASRQIGIPFIEARQAARMMGKRSFVRITDRSRLPLGFFETYDSDKLPEILRAHSRELSRRKYQL